MLVIRYGASRHVFYAVPRSIFLRRPITTPSGPLQASERSSVDGTPPMVLSLIQEVPLARLMAAYAGRILGGNDPEDSRISAREDVSEGLKWRASRDCNVKVYSVVPHPLHVEVRNVV